MTCFECGKTFTVEADEPFGDERDVCYECEREKVAEVAPEVVGEQDDRPDEADFLVYEDGCCVFCGGKLRSREVFAGCDDSEIYCPECGYVEGIE